MTPTPNAVPHSKWESSLLHFLPHPLSKGVGVGVKTNRADLAAGVPTRNAAQLPGASPPPCLPYPADASRVAAGSAAAATACGRGRGTGSDGSAGPGRSPRPEFVLYTGLDFLGIESTGHPVRSGFFSPERCVSRAGGVGL